MLMLLYKWQALPSILFRILLHFPLLFPSICASQSMRRVVEAGAKDTELLPRGYTLVRVSAGCIINATRSRLAFLAVAHHVSQQTGPSVRSTAEKRITH